MSRPANARFIAALVVAALAGIALAWLDTRPGFDDSGVLAGLLVIAGIGSVLVAGRASTLAAVALGILVGGPTPIAEIASGGQAASLVALVFALGATIVTSLVLRAGRDG